MGQRGMAGVTPLRRLIFNTKNSNVCSADGCRSLAEHKERPLARCGPTPRFSGEEWGEG